MHSNLFYPSIRWRHNPAQKNDNSLPIKKGKRYGGTRANSKTLSYYPGRISTYKEIQRVLNGLPGANGVPLEGRGRPVGEEGTRSLDREQEGPIIVPTTTENIIASRFPQGWQVKYKDLYWCIRNNVKREKYNENG